MNYANKGLGYSRQTQCCVPCTAQNRWLKHLSLKSQETLPLLLLTAQLKQLHFRQEKTQQCLQHGVYLLQIVVLLFFKKEKQHKNAIPSWFFFLYFFFFFKKNELTEKVCTGRALPVWLLSDCAMRTAMGGFGFNLLPYR